VGLTKSLVRDHEVEYDPTSNLLSLLGGKWTTYRLMAKDAVDAACDLLDISAQCGTETHQLVGAKGWDSDFWKKIQADYGLEADISQHLAQKYGTRARRVAEIAKQNPVFSERLLAGFPCLKAEVIYAVREEMACTVRDFLARRVRLEITDWQAASAAVPIVAKLMGTALDWTEKQCEAEGAAYQKLLENFKKQADGNHSKP
jgi:glycerol-3-phosphate dehydrogenase